jgi:hypothetical protein
VRSAVVEFLVESVESGCGMVLRMDGEEVGVIYCQRAYCSGLPQGCGCG